MALILREDEQELAPEKWLKRMHALRERWEFNGNYQDDTSNTHESNNFSI
jgi:hypothetical protein